MKPALSVLAVAGLVLSPVAQAVAETPPSRAVVQTVTSSALPRLTVSVDPSLPYIGRGEGIAMEETARYERFLFGEVKDGKLVRAAIVHFEEMIPGKNGGAFNYPRFRMASLGGEEYLHQIWPMPTNEVLDGEDLRALLSARGIKVEGPWLVGRYARGVGADKQHEILIFYMESEAALGSPVEPLIPLWTTPMGQGIAGPKAKAVESGFIERQKKAVTIGG